MASRENGLNVAALAHANGGWRGTLPVAAFERLGSALASDAGDVRVGLDFSLDGDERPRVQGLWRLNAEVECSGCLRVAEVDARGAIDFRVVASDAQAEALGPEVDAVVCAERSPSAVQLIEDDLLLGLPEAACPDMGRCPHAAALRAEMRGAAGAAPDEQPASPFAALRALGIL